ncbi:MAG: AAA family ATPase [Bacteroidota bacterium]
MLAGKGRNGLLPHEAGDHAQVIEALYEAHETGGTEAVRKAWSELAQQDANLAGWLASDPDPLDELGLMTGAQLLGMDFPPIQHIADPVLPEGCSLLASPPKSGKTWLALNLALAVATGGRACSTIPVRKGRALYVNYDGATRGMQRRLKTMLGPEGALPHDFILTSRAQPFPSADEGGIDVIRQFVERYPDTRLVVIDTLERFRPRRSHKEQLYATDYEAVAQLRDLSNETGASVLILHHTRKSEGADVLDQVSGSTGLTGGVENVLLLRKERGTPQAKLTIVPREDEEREVALRFDPSIGVWELLGDADQVAKTAERQRVLDVLRPAEEPMQAKEIAAILDEKPNTVTKLLLKMKKEGKVIQPKYGCWEVSPLHPGHTDHSGHASGQEGVEEGSKYDHYDQYDGGTEV